jgi:tetratricopeptide (TPR) repeat protein
MPTLREYELALQRDPAADEPFRALRQAYRESGKFDKLVTLYEARGQALEDGPRASELFYLAAEVRIDQLGDQEGAEADLMHAVDRDPDNLKAVDRLKLMFREQGRVPDLLTVLEIEAVAAARIREASRISALQSDIGRLEAQQLARFERAVGLPAAQRQAEVTPEALKVIESLRRIHRALGAWPAVVRLYELELSLTAEAKRRSDLLLALGRVLGEKVGDLQGAAQHLNEVVRLRPRDDKALEALAAVYANKAWLGADGKERAAGVYHQVARRRHEAGDVDSAIASLRKAMAALPGHVESSELLERILYEAGRLPDLDLYYRERVADAQAPEEKMDFLFKRAQLAEGDMGNPAEAMRVYEEIVAIEPPAGPASQRLADLYISNQDFGKLAQLRERQLEGITDPAFRIGVLQELAALYRDRLGDPEQAAVYLHAILQEDPGHPEAQQAYAEHFRQRGDYQALADLLEFSFDHARGIGAPAEELLARLEEIAVISERSLQDSDRALLAWQRMEELSPGHDRAREAQKRILQKGKQWDKMASVLEREAQGATDPSQRIEILKRLARTHIEKLGSTDKAVGVYREILAIDGRDAAALRALIEIYEKGERWADLATLMRAQVDQVSIKQEKLNVLRRLMWLYDDRLDDRVEGSWAATEILKLAPGDREALERLEAILERTGDKARLVETLTYHSRYAATTEEKQRLLHRIADLLHNQLGDVAQAVGFWEELLRLNAGDQTALDALTFAYDQLGRPRELAHVLDLQIERLGDDPAARAEFVRRLARLLADTLQEAASAQRAWEDLVRLLPSDPEALAELGATYRRKGDWRNLVGILERQIPLAPDAGAAVELALERARIFEEELKIRAEAIAALEQIVAELDPRCLPAYERVRRLSEVGGDWARVVAVAERQLFLTEAPEERIARALEIGVLWRDRLGDPRKATAAFERAVEIDPNSTAALSALATLYLEAADHTRLVWTDEKLLSLATLAPERRRLMFEIAATLSGPLREPRLAFEWYRRAYTEQPDAETLAHLEALAEAHRLWEELIQIYDGTRARSRDAGEQATLVLKVARIAEEALGDPRRAFGILSDALATDPSGERLLPEIERLAEKASAWPGLLEAYARVARARPSGEDRVELLRRRARVREDGMSDPSGALDELLRAFGLDPTRPDARAEILRLAELTGRWEDALKVEAQLFGRAEGSAKVEVACRAAALVEDKVKDRLRAFRAYLSAFRLAPDDETIVAHLWRLAELISRGGPSAVPESADDAEELDADLVEEMEVGDEELEAVEDARSAAPPVPSRPGAPDVRGAPGAPTAKPPAPPTVWEEFAQAYELLPAADTSARYAKLRRITEIWERGAKDIDRALKTLERTFQIDANDAAVRADLRRIAEQEGRWDDVCEIYLRAAEGLGREAAVGLQHDVASFREALGQMDRAEERHRAILLLEPGDQRAMDRLEDIFRTQSRWADLASLLEKRTAGALEALPAGAARRKKSEELAELYEKRLDRPYEAIDTLERFVGTSEEDERGAEHPDVVLENCGAFDALSRLYSRVGMWGKAVDALQREVDLVGEPVRLRELRAAMAGIYERELAQPEQAAAAYEAILSEAPEDAAALAALDRILEGQGRFERLAEVLRRRAEIESGEARAELIRRRARLLEEELGNPDAAAASLRALGVEALRDDATSEALLRNLGRAGLAHEALRIVQQRIDMANEDHAPPDRMVALHVAAATLQTESLDDAAAARRSLEAALELVPDHAAALGALARLELRTNDFGAYARARRREAEALLRSGTDEGKEAAAAAFLEAGRVLRDQIGDPAEARPCFESALRADGRNVQALRSLGSLLSGEGHLIEAQALFENHIEDIEAPGDRAALLTDLARMMWERPGDAPEAIARLDEALVLAPDYLPAVVTMADIYFKEQQWSEAERRLMQALRRMKGQPAEMAQLYHRLAEVYERLGRLEEGYRQLLEADRAVPGQLLIRLALGENRFQSKKWREASTHLEGIADHGDAHRYPEEVALGLYRAGQAELRLKRPERAMVLLQEALRFSVDHAPTLRALAELALERGEKREAAQHLKRLAEGAGERLERAKLFEELGDVHVSLEEKEDARRAYEAAVALLDEAREAQVSLLQKTLDVQRATGAVAEAAATANRLIDLVEDPGERASRRRDAALLLLERGAADRAAAYLEQAHAESPTDEAVLASMVVAFEETFRGADLEPILAKALDALPPVEADKALEERRAGLWEALGRLRAETTVDKAIAALERAVAIQPARSSAREVLARLYGDRVDTVDAALANHRALVALDVTRAESLRALGHAYAGQGRLDWARCVLEVLDLLGLADEEDRSFLASFVPPTRKPDDPYARPIEDADRGRHLSHPEARAMSEVFASIWEGAPGISGSTLESLGLSAHDKISPLAEATIGKIYGQTAKALGNKRSLLYVSHDPTFEGVQILVPPPPTIVVSQHLADASEPTALRFLIGRALELSRPEYILGHAMPAKEFAQLFAAVLKAFHPRHAKWRAGDPGTEQAAKLKKALPYKVSKRLAELFQEHEAQPFNSARWRSVVQETGNRAGLVMCGDLATAARIVLREILPDAPPEAPPALVRDQASKSGPLRELLRFAISDEYFALREGLGTSVSSAAAA